MKFPIVFKQGDAELPDDKLYYEVAANGLFQVKDTPIYRSVTRASADVPGLEPESERLQMKFPRIPSEILVDVLCFFREVYERYDGEAIVMLFYQPETRTYQIGVPEQTIPGYFDWKNQWRSYLRLDYVNAARPEGFLRFGSIHSHAELSAVASGTDCDDERFEEGLHVVYGHIDRSPLSRSASFSVGGTRFRVNPEDVLEDCDPPQRPARADWMAQVTTQESVAPAYSYGYSSVNGSTAAPQPTGVITPATEAKKAGHN